MKYVPIFFLVGLSLLHLIHVIAIPNVKRTELERMKVKRAAAISRFNKSKRNAPFKSPWKRRFAVVIKLRKYTNYLRAVTKRYLRSAKALVETQMTGFRERVFDTLGRHLAVMPSFQAPIGKKWEKQSAESNLALNERYQTLSESTIDEEEDDDADRYVIQITTSAYELFKQVAQEMLLRIRSFNTDPAVDGGFKSLKAAGLALEAKTQKKRMKENLKKQIEKDELLSTTFIPIPSEGPSLDPTPGTNPEPSTRESPIALVKDHDLEYSDTPAPAGLRLNGVATPPGSVLTFRRLARFAARI